MAPTYKIIYSADAQKQIDDILDYFLDEHSLSLAVKMQHAFLDAVEKAAKMPTAYPLERKFKSKTDIPYRRIVTKSYAFVYKIVEVIDSIIVVRVYHVKVNTKFFKEDLP